MSECIQSLQFGQVAALQPTAHRSLDELSTYVAHLDSVSVCCACMHERLCIVPALPSLCLLQPVGWRARGSGGVYGDTWWQHWAVLAQEVLTATCTSAEPDDLLDLLLYPTDGVQGVYSRGSVAEGLCHVLGYDAVLFKQQEPRSA